MKTPFEGGCLCGRRRYHCHALPFVAYTCHCLACQKLTASAFATCIQVPAEALESLGVEAEAYPRIAQSGNRLSTWLCPACGSALYSQNAARPRIRTIYAGSLDDASQIAVSAHIWTRRRMPWVVLPQGHRVFAEAGDWRPDYASDPSRLTLEPAP